LILAGVDWLVTADATKISQETLLPELPFPHLFCLKIKIIFYRHVAALLLLFPLVDMFEFSFENFLANSSRNILLNE